MRMRDDRMPIWQQMAYVAALIEMRHWPWGPCPHPTRVSRALRWLSERLHQLTVLADGEVRCPFCDWWYMRFDLDSLCWVCSACGEQWRWRDWYHDICQPRPHDTFAERWAAAEERRRTPIGWLQWQEARVVGWLRNRWRALQAAWQRLTVGYAYEEVWNLNDHLAAWVLPRLRHFREHGMMGHPPELTYAQWQWIVDEMIHSLDIYVRDNCADRGELTDEEEREVCDPDSRYRRGLRLFGRYWEALWD